VRISSSAFIAPAISVSSKVSVLAAILAWGPILPANTATIFIDNFGNGPSSAWDNAYGNWTASGGAYFANNPSADPNAHSLVSGLSLTNFSVDVVVNNPWSDSVGGAGGVWLRATNDSGPLGVAGVLFVWAHSPLDMYWHVVLPGQTCCPTPYGFWPNLVQFGPAPSSFSVHIEVEGDLYSAFVNGQLVTSLINDQFTSGTVGLYDGNWALQPGTQSFDHFKVSTIHGQISWVQDCRA
jgi:hypothetical protein